MSTPQSPSEDDFVRITLRLPADLHRLLTEAAAKRKSMNAEIIERLQLTFLSRDSDNKATKPTSSLSDEEISSMIEAFEERMSIISETQKSMFREAMFEQQHTTNILFRKLFDEIKDTKKTLNYINQYLVSSKLLPSSTKESDS